MKSGKRWLRVSTVVLAGVFAAGGAQAAAEDDLAPYKVLRSLQFVQDKVVHGDHAAGEMQRFILETIDQRLRSADASVFEDPRNVDAALIYSMSGGNPDTLDYLIARDLEGNFDTRVVDALRKYFNGQGTLIARGLADMVPEYRDTRVGPYLALVSGNIVLSTDVEQALGFFDQARLTAPGTIVEEAALRRSLTIAVERNMVPRALTLASRYARRFLHSPYASQFADLFVQFVTNDYGAVTQEEVVEIVQLMDPERGREVFLRIARRAALAGHNELARMAAEQAERLGTAEPDGREALGSLYGNVAAVPSTDVDSAVHALSQISDDQLSDRDRALRDAARTIAAEIKRLPATVASPAQEPRANTLSDEAARAAGASAGVPPDLEDGERRAFVQSGRSQLEAIDALLGKEGR